MRVDVCAKNALDCVLDSQIIKCFLAVYCRVRSCTLYVPGPMEMQDHRAGGGQQLSGCGQ